MKVAIGQFLTEDEINKAIVLYGELEELGHPELFARRCCQLIIEPNIDRIDKALGQENLPLFLAYMVEYAVLTAIRQKRKES